MKGVVTTDDLNAKIAEFHAALLAKGYDAAHVYVQIEASSTGAEYTTWAHGLLKGTNGLFSGGDGESRRHYGIATLDAALQTLAADIADMPPRYTAADLQPWFDPLHEMNRVSA